MAVDNSSRDLKAHFRAHDLHVAPCANASVRASLGSVGVVDVIDHGCSCSFYVGDESAMKEREVGALRAKYAKKGWGSAKIDRAVASASRPRNSAEPSPRQRLLAGLGELHRSGARIRLLSHEYTGRFDDETFPLAVPRAVSLQRLAGEPIPVDVVLSVEA